jgi:hypothetical protein
MSKPDDSYENTVFCYPSDVYQEFDRNQSFQSASQVVVAGFIEMRKSVQIVLPGTLPIRLGLDLKDFEFKNIAIQFTMSQDDLARVDGIDSWRPEFYIDSTSSFIFLSIHEIKKRIPGFEMKGPGWSWSANDASWKEVPKPDPEFVWSSLQTWEQPCNAESCKIGGCSGLNPHFDMTEHPEFMGKYENSFFIFEGHGGNFCEQGKEKCLCKECDRYYDPHNPIERGRHTAAISMLDEGDGTHITACLLDTLSDW